MRTNMCDLNAWYEDWWRQAVPNTWDCLFRISITGICLSHARRDVTSVTRLSITIIDYRSTTTQLRTRLLANTSRLVRQLRGLALIGIRRCRLTNVLIHKSTLSSCRYRINNKSHVAYCMRDLADNPITAVPLLIGTCLSVVVFVDRLLCAWLQNLHIRNARTSLSEIVMFTDHYSHYKANLVHKMAVA